MTRTEIINKIIKDKVFQSYLEIGLGDLGNFNLIKGVNKVGVDPNVTTLQGFKDASIIPFDSDVFFSENDEKFDLIFIDGLHHSDQVERDIVNSWNALNKGGIILIHDIKPFDEASQVVPRQQDKWVGDVWRAWYGLKNTYPKLKLSYIDERAGIGMIEKSRHKIESGFVDMETTYQEYDYLKGWEV